MSNFGEKIKCLDERSIELIQIVREDIKDLKNIKFNDEYINLIKSVIDDIEYEDYYNEKEARKILITLNYMMKIVRENLAKGLEYRNNEESINTDKEFKFEELLDAVIIFSKNEFEEKKLKYCGFLLGNMVFKKELNQDECNRLIRLITTLSYCKIKLINLYCISQTIQVPILKREDYTKTGISDYKLLGILQDTLDMIQRGILNGSGKLVLDVVQINPSQIRVQGGGTLLYNLMSLNKMPYDEMEDLLDILSNK